MIAVVTKKISTFNCCESGGTSKDAPVMGAEQQPPVGMVHSDGTPCAVKAARTVWRGGKDGEAGEFLLQTLTYHDILA